MAEETNVQATKAEARKAKSVAGRKEAKGPDSVKVQEFKKCRMKPEFTECEALEFTGGYRMKTKDGNEFKLSKEEFDKRYEFA